MTETGKPATVRGSILQQAKDLTEGDRNASYGDPVENMDCYNQLVAAYLRGSTHRRLSPIDGAVFACLLKISRIAASPLHRDNYVDLAAYAAIAGECAEVVREVIEEDKA